MKIYDSVPLKFIIVSMLIYGGIKGPPTQT